MFIRASFSSLSAIIAAAGLSLTLAGASEAMPDIEKFMKIRAPNSPVLAGDGTLYVRDWPDDMGCIELTRYPQGMIAALQKLGESNKPMRAANRATQHMFIVDPMKNGQQNQRAQFTSAMRTHPPLKDRIARLRELIE